DAAEVAAPNIVIGSVYNTVAIAIGAGKCNARCSQLGAPSDVVGCIHTVRTVVIADQRLCRLVSKVDVPHIPAGVGTIRVVNIIEPNHADEPGAAGPGGGGNSRRGWRNLRPTLRRLFATLVVGGRQILKCVVSFVVGRAE